MIDHNTMIRHLGVCDCRCHRDGGNGDGCWCDPHQATIPTPHRIAHNDAVREFGACPSPHHRHTNIREVTCQGPTNPKWAQAFNDQSAATERRLRRGDIRNSSELSQAIRRGYLPRGRGPGR